MTAEWNVGGGVCRYQMLLESQPGKVLGMRRESGEWKGVSGLDCLLFENVVASACADYHCHSASVDDALRRTMQKIDPE
jgi:hypothetical protein